jgi:hypothetical protein
LGPLFRSRAIWFELRSTLGLFRSLTVAVRTGYERLWRARNAPILRMFVFENLLPDSFRSSRR